MENALLAVLQHVVFFKDEFGLILLAEVSKYFTQEEMFELGRRGVEICWEVKEDKERLVKVPMSKKCRFYDG